MVERVELVRVGVVVVALNARFDRERLARCDIDGLRGLLMRARFLAVDAEGTALVGLDVESATILGHALEQRLDLGTRRRPARRILFELFRLRLRIFATGRLHKPGVRTLREDWPRRAFVDGVARARLRHRADGVLRLGPLPPKGRVVVVVGILVGGPIVVPYVPWRCATFALWPRGRPEEEAAQIGQRHGATAHFPCSAARVIAGSAPKFQYY